ncbi:AI-2E family transporter [Mycolicibacterium diernhoferi]|uniref:AI-2E family transporter n=1 Tax=Mycolicibacterium diernhoferi TaxID=1801 RepID=A0A1Q4H9P8_9MYCO|nr:AI-2E family transporter [Mycolicibacterium diernhoferi]OJZ64142.1 AI-2E family transporter [Mycolicibacterium diernhoferi]OPE54857.1 AI-2E family transporter [Mycolicibacterium diernhoferi]PEG55251.1 AI-2E family transporter [Mycolicibacterium diernhoferi]QYL21726.1 AI-2E family transporter [Mycolicibacterium diernhoferi]
MNTEFTVGQRRALAIATVVALAFGAYFLRGFFMLIVVAAVVAYLFDPLYERLRKRFSSGLSATLTLFAALATVIVPISAAVAIGVVQISHMVRSVADWVGQTDLSTLGDRSLRLVNELLDRVPFLQSTNITAEQVQEWVVKFAQRAGEWGLSFLQGAAGGLFGGVTAAIIFLYVFISMLVNGDQLRLLIRRLNPLGEEATDLYLAKMAAMVRGTVRGQFVIALVQGVAGAISIYLAGFHDGFFIFAILLSALSVIPLGGGIVTIPFGIGLVLFGNIVGGIFVIAFHLLVVTNIDNVLRPILVPKEARLDPALMLLSVFAGITMFGFLGIVIGPVIMIVIVTTISVYLWVYKGVPMDLGTEDDEPDKPTLLKRLIARARARTASRRRAAAPVGGGAIAPPVITPDAD